MAALAWRGGLERVVKILVIVELQEAVHEVAQDKKVRD
jgi:hypothetical protein